MLEMSVVEAAWRLTSFVFSIKSDVINNKSLKRRKIQGAHIKSFPCPGGPPRPCVNV